MIDMLKVSGLTKRFGGIQAATAVSFEVPHGTITSLIGPNGAGKTTVFNLISGLIRPDTGTVTLDGVDLTTLPAWKRSRAGLTRTFQLSRLFRNLSIGDNLALARRTEDDQLLKMFWRGDSLETEEMDQVREMMRFVGLDMDLATPITDLSYGQQKLFDLARALLNPHILLMLDEPVAGVNPVLRETLQDTLRALRAKGETILLIEHDMEFVRAVSDTVIVMDQGAVLASGAPDQVLSDERVLEAYLGPNS